MHEKLTDEARLKYGIWESHIGLCLVDDMDNHYISNCIKKIKKNKAKGNPMNLCDEWIKLFKNELNFRKENKDANRR